MTDFNSLSEEEKVDFANSFVGTPRMSMLSHLIHKDLDYKVVFPFVKDPNVRDDTYATTPLIAAILTRNMDAVRFLTYHRVDINAVMANGDSPLFIALSCQRMDIFYHILSLGPYISPTLHKFWGRDIHTYACNIGAWVDPQPMKRLIRYMISSGGMTSQLANMYLHPVVYLKEIDLTKRLLTFDIECQDCVVFTDEIAILLAQKGLLTTKNLVRSMMFWKKDDPVSKILMVFIASGVIPKFDDAMTKLLIDHADVIHVLMLIGHFEVVPRIRRMAQNIKSVRHDLLAYDIVYHAPELRSDIPIPSLLDVLLIRRHHLQLQTDLAKVKASIKT